MRAKITKRQVDALRPGEIIADEEVKGFVARRLISGIVTYGFRYRDKTTRRQRWIGLGLHGSITAEKARDMAKRRAGEVAGGRDPVEERQAERTKAEQAKHAKANTVSALLDTFVERYVRKNGLRGAYEVERVFNRYVRPRIGKKSITS